MRTSFVNYHQLIDSIDVTFGTLKKLWTYNFNTTLQEHYELKVTMY